MNGREEEWRKTRERNRKGHNGRGDQGKETASRHSK